MEGLLALAIAAVALPVLLGLVAPFKVALVVWSALAVTATVGQATSGEYQFLTVVVALFGVAGGLGIWAGSLARARVLCARRRDRWKNAPESPR